MNQEMKEMKNINAQTSELTNKFLNSKQLEDDKRKLLSDMYDKLLYENTSMKIIQKNTKNYKRVID